MVEVVVADTGPLIALARLELLGMPGKLFRRVLITPMVLSECVAKPDKGEGALIKAALDAGLFQLVEAPDADPEWTVDEGEASSIALAMSQDLGVLIDDKAGRKLARQMNRPVIGTAGLLALAKRKGQLGLVRPYLDALTESGYFLGDDVVATVLRLAGE